MKERRHKNHLEAIRWAAWACIAFWVVVGYVAHRTINASMQPVISAITHVADRVER